MVTDIKQKYISCSVVRFTSGNSNFVLVDVSVTGEDAIYLCCCYFAMNDRSVNSKMTPPSLSRIIPDLDSPISPSRIYLDRGKYDKVKLPCGSLGNPFRTF